MTNSGAFQKKIIWDFGLRQHDELHEITTKFGSRPTEACAVGRHRGVYHNSFCWLQTAVIKHHGAKLFHLWFASVNDYCVFVYGSLTYCHFGDNIFIQMQFANKKFCILIKISLKFVPKGSIDNNPTLVSIIAGHRICDKPLSEPKLTPFTALGGDEFIWK